MQPIEDPLDRRRVVVTCTECGRVGEAPQEDFRLQQDLFDRFHADAAE